MVSAQWIVLTDLDPLEVEGGELRGFKGMTTVCGPWLAVVGVMVGAHDSLWLIWRLLCHWDMVELKVGPWESPCQCCNGWTSALVRCRVRRDNGLYGEVRVLCSGDAVAAQDGEDGGSSAPPEVCGRRVPFTGPLVGAVPQAETAHGHYNGIGEVLGASDFTVQKAQTWRWEEDVHSAHWGFSGDLGTDTLSPK